MNSTSIGNLDNGINTAQPPVGLRVVLWLVYLVTFTFGNLLLVSILHYERYGGDPQKRSLGNRLAADMCLAILLCTSMGIVPLVVVEAEIDAYMPWDIYIRIYRFAFFTIVTFMNLHTLAAYIQVGVAHLPKSDDENNIE